jgi:hypothetical protein
VLFSLLGGNQKSFSPCSLSIFPCFWIWKEYKEYKDLKRKREFIILLRRDSGKEGTMPVRFFFLPFLFFLVVSSGFVGCVWGKKERREWYIFWFYPWWNSKDLCRFVSYLWSENLWNPLVLGI